MCFSSLFVARDEFSLETLTFVFPLFFFNACIILREEERMSFSLFALCFSLCGEDFFECDGDGNRLRRLRQRRSNDR